MPSSRKFLILHLPGGAGLTETIRPAHIESMRPTLKGHHAPESHTVVRSTSGREVAVINRYPDLVKEWDDLIVDGDK